MPPMKFPAYLATDRLTRGSSVSGGFATVQPGSQLSINAVEGFPLEEFSSEVCFSAHIGDSASAKKTVQ